MVMDESVVLDVIKLLQDEFTDEGGEYTNDVVCTAVDMLLRLIDPDFDEVA